MRAAVEVQVEELCRKGEHRSYTVDSTMPMRYVKCCDCDTLVDIFPLLNRNRFKIVILEEDFNG